MASTGGVKLGSSFDEARTRKMNAEAELAELTLAQVHNTLVLVDDVAKAWEDVLSSFKAKLLSIPSKSAPILASESDPSICQKVLDDLIEETLTELSQYDPSKKPKTEEKAKGRGRPKKNANIIKS